VASAKAADAVQQQLQKHVLAKADVDKADASVVTLADAHGQGHHRRRVAVHDAARTGTNLLKRMVASKTGVQRVAVGEVEAVVVDVVAPTPAPSSPIDCPEYRLRYGADDPKYLALCAALRGATETKCNVGKAAGEAPWPTPWGSTRPT